MPDAWNLRYAPHLGVRSLDAPLFLHSAGSADPLVQIRHAAALGFAGVQDNQAKLRAPEVQRRMGAELARLGMAMGCIVNTPQDSLPLGSSDPAVRDALLAEVRSSIETARRLGGRHIVIVAAREPKVPETLQRVQLAENLKAAADLAARSGMVLCLEAVSRLRVAGLLLRHLADAYAVVRAIDHSAVQLVFDTFHVQSTDGDLINQFLRVKEVAAVVQIADSPDRLEPGTGEIHFANLLRVITQSGYTGLVELEHGCSKQGLGGEQAALRRLREIDATL